MHVRLRIAHRQEKIACRAKLHAMHALVIVPLWQTPQQLLRLQPLPFGNGTTDPIQRSVAEHEQVIVVPFSRTLLAL